jgi:hypothetical protein
MSVGLIPNAHCSVDFTGVERHEDKFCDAMGEE